MPDSVQLAEQIFADALDLTPGERTAFLDQACANSSDLRRQVETLLREHEAMGSFLASPLVPIQLLADVAASSTHPYPELRPGQNFGRYTILEPLGSGGMGAVFRARDEKLERTVAIKVLSRGMVTTAEGRRRFRKEGLALAKLSHANIAAVYDVGEQDGVEYIVMECVSGQSLSSVVAAGPAPIRDATSIVVQIAQALEEAHEKGIIHRDLKPANVMLTPRGQVKVLDFGIAKLLDASAGDPGLTMTEANVVMGTPRYMSPEQAEGKPVDARTDLWSLGAIFYELLSGQSPFPGDDSYDIIQSVVRATPVPLLSLRPDAPDLADRIVRHALTKNPEQRYTSATQFVADAAGLLSGANEALHREQARSRSRTRLLAGAFLLFVALSLALGFWLYHRTKLVRWAREDAPAQIETLRSERKYLAAFLLLRKAREYAPDDPHIEQLAAGSTLIASVQSTPAGASVAIQDYLTPKGEWYELGRTPITDVQLPNGYFRWKLTNHDGEHLLAPETSPTMNFTLDRAEDTPPGMVAVPRNTWGDAIGFVGWLGPYDVPQFFVDRHEVSNREYQNFVDSGGYSNPQLWKQPFLRDGRALTWSEAMAEFHDSTGRPGPSGWVGGHYPDGQADLPVTGVSWFEASAYAASVGKSLPVVAQWFQIAPPEQTPFVVPESNFSGTGLAPVATYPGLGPEGTYDAAGNAREWIANAVDGDLHFILGGSWKSPSYLYYSPEALSPFDRSDTNGFRCVKNASPLPDELLQPITRKERDFTRFKPVSDEVFNAYRLLYAYPPSPLHATVEGVVEQTTDWTEQKISYDAGYNGERMSAYLFLPRHAKPPFQTVLFFPSARVLFLPDSRNSRVLGDVEFFDYIIQSGRAVMYPIYEGTYERRERDDLPSGSQPLPLTIHHVKDAARSLDYLATRPDIDSGRLAYLGVSMGAEEGVIISSLLQDRFRTAVLLDGGYFLDPAPAGGDAAEFALRMRKPVLMVNGRYDFTFPLEKSQNPLFTMLATPPADKRHVVLETPHDVTEQRPQLVREVLAWLDHYLGRV